MSHRESVMRALLRYDRPPGEVLEELAACGTDVEGPTEEEGEPAEVALTPDDVVHVLTRYLENDITVQDLEEWTDIVTQHDEVVLVDDHRESLAELLDEMAELTLERAEAWLARLEGED